MISYVIVKRSKVFTLCAGEPLVVTGAPAAPSHEELVTASSAAMVEYALDLILFDTIRCDDRTGSGMGSQGKKGIIVRGETFQ